MAQGTHSFGGDVHGWLPVQRRQHGVLDVAECSAGQLDGETDKSETDETLLLRIDFFFLYF